MLKKNRFSKNHLIFLISHMFLAGLILVMLLLPDQKDAGSKFYFFAVVGLIEILGLLQFFIKRGKQTVAGEILSIIWCFFLWWEWNVTKCDRMHPVLAPAPEKVFSALWSQRDTHINNIAESMKLLLAALVVGLGCAVVIGLICGWIKRLGDVLYPIAVVMTPIPAVVYAPYIIACMPSFRSASFAIVVIGVIFPNLLNMITRVKGIDQSILDAAHAMNIKGLSLVIKVLLPYTLPSILSGLKVTVTTSIMLLLYAEMMGATKGLGYYIVNYNTYGNYTNVIGGIIVIAITVTVLNRLAEWISKHSIHWQ